jgi:hypothetical protein
MRYSLSCLGMCFMPGGVFARWLLSEGAALDAVTTDVIIRYMEACRRAPQPGGKVYSIRDDRAARFAIATVNRRLAAISGLLGYREMPDPASRSRDPQRPRSPQGRQRGALG